MYLFKSIDKSYIKILQKAFSLTHKEFYCSNNDIYFFTELISGFSKLGATIIIIIIKLIVSFQGYECRL